jgi:glycosyltransferase involved in cell wall biosynthesis
MFRELWRAATVIRYRRPAPGPIVAAPAMGPRTTSAGQGDPPFDDGRRRFGTVDPFVEGGDWSFRMGRTIANRGFLRALLQNGGFDQYDLFCADARHRRELGREIAAWLPDPAAMARVRCLLPTDLAPALRRTRYEVFHGSDFTFSLPYLAWLRNAFAREPFPLTGVTHSLDGVRMASRHVELALAGLAPYDAIVCTSQAGRDAVAHAAAWVRARLPGGGGPGTEGAGPQLPVIPLGVPDEAFALPDRAVARAQFRIPLGRRVLLSVGRLSVRSKCDWSPFLELFARMRVAGELDGALVLIAGGASDADVATLDQMIARLGLADTVLVFPNFPPELKASLFAAADIYLGLVDNIQETFGLSVVEALAAGLPTIAVDYSGYRDIVEDGRSGLLVPTVASPSLPPALTDSIGILDSGLTRFAFAQGLAVDLPVLRGHVRALLAAEDRRRALGAQARRRAESFRWAAIVGRYEQLWAALATEARSAPRPEAAGPPILWGDMPGTFAGFARRTLAAGDRVALTDVGRALAGGVDPVTRLEDLDPFCSPELEALIVGALAEGPQAVAALVARATKALAVAESAVPFQIVFLLKHGVLAIEAPEA